MKNSFLVLTLSVMLVACSDGTNEQHAHFYGR